jgi:hypothetical protein
MGGEGTLDHHALMLETAVVAGRSPVRLRVVRAGAMPGIECIYAEQPVCWSVGRQPSKAVCQQGYPQSDCPEEG